MYPQYHTADTISYIYIILTNLMIGIETQTKAKATTGIFIPLAWDLIH